MDAEEFVKQLRRMDCQYHREFSLFDACNTPEQVVEEVEKWAKEHPSKTRQSVFLEILPNAPIRPDTGIVKISPCEVVLKYLSGTVFIFSESSPLSL